MHYFFYSLLFELILRDKDTFLLNIHFHTWTSKKIKPKTDIYKLENI